ncbi:hypothetical protein BpHYR1_039602 [Brachionus plicatilis]|uniref:Uncharacterized protein n=1 Tax=Brachionus plicatilis TaxID=10195 RepID=A0A3M7QPV0_BRAPC|nr:hypothetical protein BpHYR1_039602 [Brachionus plicatilis]
MAPDSMLKKITLYKFRHHLHVGHLEIDHQFKISFQFKEFIINTVQNRLNYLNNAPDLYLILRN